MSACVNTKQFCGRRLFSFSCLRSAKFKYTRIEQSSQIGEIDERMRLFPPAIVFFKSFRLIEIRKENDTHETT